MRKLRLRSYALLSLLLLPLLLPGCKSTDDVPIAGGETLYYVPENRTGTPRAWPKVDTEDFPKVSRAEVIRIAKSYLYLRWTPRAENRKHGLDPDGILVNTPDVNYRPEFTHPGYWEVGKESESMPYQWGGFSTPEDFLDGIRDNKYAGDIYTPEKRRLLDSAVSKHAVGIDCSGFISRCWRLPRSFSTRELPGLCRPLASWDELKPGDILNTHNAHVLLFERWLDDTRTVLVVMETGCPPTWKVCRHGLKRQPLFDFGYEAFRYRKIED